MDAQTTTLILSALTAIATAAAAVTAIFGPKIAAKYAVELQDAREAQSRKYQVFLILMAHRRNYGRTEAAQHLNIIDVLWFDNKLVKNAWAELFEAITGGEAYSFTQREERFRKLLLAIAADLKIGADFSADDFSRTYYSNAMGWREEAESLQNRAIIAQAENLSQAQQVPKPPASSPS